LTGIQHSGIAYFSRFLRLIIPENQKKTVYKRQPKSYKHRRTQWKNVLFGDFYVGSSPYCTKVVQYTVGHLFFSSLYMELSDYISYLIMAVAIAEL